MSSPVSSVVANLVMEDVKKSALETFADPPRLDKRFVDDTFVIMKKSKLSVRVFHPSAHNRELHPIHYGTRKRRISSVLDLLIKRSSNYHLSSVVYRKPIHSDRYLNFRSEHPIQQWCSNFLARGPHLSFRNHSRATRINNLNKNSPKNSLNWLKC